MTWIRKNAPKMISLLMTGSLAGVATLALAGGDAPLSRVLLSSGELRGAGIAFPGSGVDTWPNTCGDAGGHGRYAENQDGPTISTDMLRHFEARGFTLESLCLGLGGAANFDPDSGAQLPRALTTDGGISVLLNLPDCFKGGKPYHDCGQRFHLYIPFENEEHDKVDAEELAKIDTLVRAYIKRTGVEGKFTWKDLKQSDPWGFTAIQYYYASKSLPGGYGYVLWGGEGDDPVAEDVDLASYRKKPSGWSIWFDED